MLEITAKQVNRLYKVSIIVPCYNTKPWLDECLQSLIDQTLEEIEIICVNDGSIDGTGKKLDEWQAQYPDKIKVIHQQNGGASNARNTGMAIAQGEYIGFIDSDDCVDITMYKKLYIVLQDNNVDMVKCNLIGFIKEKPKFKQEIIKPINKNINTLSDIADNLFSLNCYLYKKKFLQQHKIQFIDNILFYEDHYFAYELTIYHPKIILLPDKLYYYRQQRKGQLTSHNGKNIYDMFKVFEYLENKIANKKLDNLKLTQSIIIKKQISMFFFCICKIQYKYKKDFLFKASLFVFEKNKIYDIYKNMFIRKYRNPVSYLIAPTVLILFHCCYFWQKLSLKNLKHHLKSNK